MKSFYRISLVIILLGVACIAHAQITISLHDLDSLRTEINSLKEQLKVSEEACLSKKDSLKQMQNEADNFKKQISALNSTIVELRDSVSLLYNESARLAEKSQDIQTMQEQADNNAAKLANGRLYFRYNADLIQSSIKFLQEIQTESVRTKFSRTLNLLQNYHAYSDEIKNALSYAQGDSDRKSRNKYNEYKTRCIGEIKRTSYYMNVFAKKNSSNWSIPYLDNIINIAFKMLQNHDPGRDGYVDFTVLIELL